MDFEVGKKTAEDVLRLLGKTEGKATSENEGEIDEAVATKKFQGTVQLRGFSPDVVDSISSNVRFRVQAANLGNRVRLIIDIQK